MKTVFDAKWKFKHEPDIDAAWKHLWTAHSITEAREVVASWAGGASGKVECRIVKRTEEVVEEVG